MAWRLALRTDPIGLLVVPFVILFPVYLFVTQLGEILRPLTRIAFDSPVSAGALGENIPFGAILGVLPLVIVAAAFGFAWLHVRADAVAQGRVDPIGRTAERALGRIGPLAVTGTVSYLLWQSAAIVLLVPGILVFALTSFATRAAVLDGLGLWASIKTSRVLVMRHWLPWLGMATYWIILFFGLGLLVAIARGSIGGIPGFEEFAVPSLVLDLVLFLPLPISLLVLDTCWTLFFRELEARARVRTSAAAA